MGKKKTRSVNVPTPKPSPTNSDLFRFSDQQRRGLLVAAGIDEQHSDAGIFVAHVEKDVEVLRFAMAHKDMAWKATRATTPKRGRPSYSAPRMFVQQLAGHFLQLLEITPGRGRTGSFARAVFFCFRAAGFGKSDLRDYIVDGAAKVVDDEDSELLQRLFTPAQIKQIHQFEQESLSEEAERKTSKKQGKEKRKIIANQRRSKVARHDVFSILAGTRTQSGYFPPKSKKKVSR